jgi:hypothetical protein
MNVQLISCSGFHRRRRTWVGAVTYVVGPGAPIRAERGGLLLLTRAALENREHRHLSKKPFG